MTKIEFLFHLQGSSYQALKFAEKYVKTELKTDFRYNVIFADIGSIDPDSEFEIYPEDKGKMELDLIDNEVVELLYRKGKVPIWIDISVLKSSRKSTTFNLLCSGQYSENKEKFYYNDNGSGPFGVKSPKLPLDYKEGRKFKLK